MSSSELAYLLHMIPHDILISIVELSNELRTLRLVCRHLRDLIDGAMCHHLRIDATSHLTGGRPTGMPIYRSRSDFTAAAARLLRRTAGALRRLELDYEAYSCCFASQLLEQQPLPQLSRVELQNAEAQHVAALHALPRLRDVGLSRHCNGLATAGPAAELLVARLSGLRLHRLGLAGYRCLPGILGSIADCLPDLRQLVLQVERVEQQDGRLDLAALPRLACLRHWELRLLGRRASAADVTVTPLPVGASVLRHLSSMTLAHVRPEAGREDAVWASLATLPALRELRYEESGHVVRQPPAPLLRLSTLERLAIQIEGAIYANDPPNSTWTLLPDLPEGSLPRLAHLRVESVGLLGLPASWCKLSLRELHISGLASEHGHYSLQLPDQLPLLAGTLRRLELPACGLALLPDEVAQLTGLTALDLRRNSITRLPALSTLQRLQYLELYGNLATNATTALQGCLALRQLGLGTRHFAWTLTASDTQDGGAYEDAEACRWQDAHLQAVRAALPWVGEVAAACNAARC